MRRLGDNVKIRCEVSPHSRSQPLWHFNGGPLPSNAVGNKNTLELTNVVKENTGYYTCYKKLQHRTISDTAHLVVFSEY